MLRLLGFVLCLFTSLAQAAPAVLQRPVELAVDGGAGQLHGTLMLPAADHPVPVVLIIAGSGPTDRDGNNTDGGRTDSLKRLAILLSRNGIASVRYDKRGVATGRAVTPDERNLSLDSYVADAVSWGRQLRQDSRFGPLIMLGHSEGALVAALAAPDAGASAVISLAGSGRPIDQVLREQIREQLPPPLVLRSDQIIERLKAGQFDTEVPAELQVVFRPSVQPYLVSLLRQNPATAFARLHMPALIVQGRNDMQVGVADADALKAAKPDAQLVLIDGMNHVLRIVPREVRAQRASYENPELPLADELGRVLVGFIKKV
ncbi:alpha/beta hydrolase [Pseudomonas sp. HR96]|uniref:alpha/beta hydrolase n=1 Tax=Pseudomonas sp. HR96 TaxID=1027966 RepID=UPI002A76203D|nr:alpha/beta hydrolase [Pseudomonas sp. HR96]WPO98833.1 alpha/beta hydrolase [Pseudomonas sp. HR96]